ncbi:MAG: phosphotransferase family protein [Burkholderiaceae bacterium]|nr:phosphotransferase family protein [Burkholderiaceae bacterium]
MSSNTLNASALADYLQGRGLSHASQPRITALTGGQSNPTFIVDDGARRLVLRKKPPGQLLASAHAIDREYRVMRALQGSEVPVPRMLGYCEDEALLGTPFYVMEFLDGRVLGDQSLPGWTREDRTRLYDDINRVIAALHGVDFRAIGLEGYGKVGQYLSRQIDRWSRQTLASTVPVPKALRELMQWLPAHLPEDDDETTLVHGDFRLDNLILHPHEPRVIGVLDWELSTLGHPLADFSYHVMSWRIAPTLWRGIGGLDLHALGIPPEADYVRRYAQRTGRDPRKHWNFYMAFSLFRMAAILHGIAERAAQGTAAAADAVETGRKAAPLAELGWACAQQA